MKFIPMPHLALAATVSDLRRVLSLPLGMKLLIFCYFTGLMLLADAERKFFNHADIPIIQWAATFLAAPIALLIGAGASYLMYRLPPAIAITERGIRYGRWGYLLPIWKPKECRVEMDSIQPHIYHFFILCKTPFTSDLHRIYHALTSDVANAELFIAAFKEKYDA